MTKHKLITTSFFLSLSCFMYGNDTTGLKAKFTFNKGSTVNETSGSKVKIYECTSVDDRFGNSNSALFLHGNFGSYINLGTGNELKPKNGTVSIWIKMDHPMPNGSGTETNPFILTHVNSDDDFNEAYIIVYDLNTKNVAANTTLSKEKQVSVYSSQPFSLRKWHHLVLTYDDKYICFYQDGVLEGKMTKNFESEFLLGDSVIVGNLFTTKNKRFFNGVVDDIEIYNRVLTPVEVSTLYKAPDPNKAAFFWKWLMIVLGTGVFALICVTIIKRRISFVLKKEHEKNQLQLNALEQRIKMLKAQMDPHFIFNSMNTILQFILANENKKAEVYLTKFSKLIRKLLVSNTNDGISLTEELDILQKYLEIESLRFNSVIQTSIFIHEKIDVNKVYMPHMMIQPFVENAIWHGLRLKEGHRKLDLRFEKMGDETLFCIIEDNGVGRANAYSELAEGKEQSLAINFIEQRLDLMSKIYGGSYDLKIIDKVNEKNECEGTRIELTLPII